MTRATESAFRRAIAADPLAALPRLAFADYLEEEGQGERGEGERAEAIRAAVPRLLALNLELVRVPAGPSRFATRPAPQGLPRFTCFWMGSPGSDGQARSDEKPQHQVTLTRDFYIGKYPVTQGQWRAVMGTNPSWFSRDGGGNYKIKDLSDEEAGRLPVEKVSWDDVRKFLDALNELESNAGCGLIYRLPTEAEWEYACRGGATSREDCSHRFYFDRPVDRLTPKRANYGGKVGRTSPVGSYSGNALGLCDMHGNVWEWCSDWYDHRAYRDGSPRTDPTGSQEGPLRVFRGGSWNVAPRRCRSAYRGGVRSSVRLNFMGLRVAAVPPTQD